MLKQEMSLTNSISSNMDTRRTGSFLASRSMGTKDICILVMHDDPKYHNIILEMLENCIHYEVMKFKRTADALNNIQEKKDSLNIVVTDVHRSHSNGFEIPNYIEKEFKLPVISMNPHQNSRVVSVGLGSEAKIYYLKSLSVNEFKTLWQHAYTKQRGNSTSFQKVSEVQEKEGGTNLERESPIREVSREDQNHQKRKIEEADEQSEKKQRVTWNEAMHRRFLKAVQQLGHDRALPKKILEVMQVPGLTRDNVASHLQKYRLCLNRADEEIKSTNSNSGINSTPVHYFQPSFSQLNSLDTNHFPYHTPNPFFSSYQAKSNPSNNSNFAFLENSTSTLNRGQQRFPHPHNSFLVSNAQNNTCNINISMPLPNLFPNHPETSTGKSHFEQQNFFTVHNQESPIFPYIDNSPLFDTTHIHSGLLANENTQPDYSNNAAYVGLNADMTDKADYLNEGNGNKSQVQFPLMQVNNSNEQGLYLHPAECGIEDLFDFNGVLLGHN